MPERHFEPVEPRELALAGRRLEGEFEVARLARLGGVTGSRVRYAFEFSLDESGRVRVRGAIGGGLDLECQRCLERFAWRYDLAVDLLVVASEEEAAALEPGLEATVAEGGRIALASLIADEIVLALPVAPAHPADECEAPAAAQQAGGAPAGTHRPFAALLGGARAATSEAGEQSTKE